MDIEESMETRVSPDRIWQAWERAHAVEAKAHRGVRYKIIDRIPGQRFTLLWKTLFVRLLFTHAVSPTKWGAKVSYSLRFQGLFAWLIRLLLKEKIRKNVRLALRSTVQKLEE